MREFCAPAHSYDAALPLSSSNSGYSGSCHFDVNSSKPLISPRRSHDATFANA